MGLYSVEKLIEETRRLAMEYRLATGKPLPVTAEIANYDAANLLGLDVVKQTDGVGYDCVGIEGKRKGIRYQVKGRAIFDELKGGQRMGQLKTEQEWDAILLVLMDDSFHTYEIYEASREKVMASLNEVKNSNRNKRGAFSVARFRAFADLVWCKEEGAVDDDGVWENHPGS
ncbi:MAG: hypothetical protein HQL49_03565 [Gammaproteobacteria bacterium]|nr:hypothetical protein [Gammaproteobacteria bacterium]